MADYTFFDRDLSWLSFNERVLLEAANSSVPLVERLKFLSIYASNLDEFYRVRVPSLMALSKLNKDGKKNKQADYTAVLNKVKEIVDNQLATFGRILTIEVLPQLRDKGIHVLYNEPVPAAIKEQLSEYFFNHVLGYLQPIAVEKDTAYFFENNKCYSLAILRNGTAEILKVINIPAEHLPRFLSINADGKQYIVFLEDIIKENLPKIFKQYSVAGVYNFKITRDAELELQDEYEEDVVDKMEKQIAKRDFGLATRFLYDAKMPRPYLHMLVKVFNLDSASMVEGGTYHNLKDFASIPVNDSSLVYDKWPSRPVKLAKDKSLLEQMAQEDIILHPPYHTYDLVLRFFNEAALDYEVEEIYVTLYRVAQQSKIVNALISAARNGKKVTVLVELKARFDESNNIKWTKRMKDAGIKIIHSPTSLKVHAKIALVKKRVGEKVVYAGLLATGNLNEVTARFYTDHILLTSHREMLRELELLFIQLSKKHPASEPNAIPFHHLLVAQFNLKKKFTQLIDREIKNAKQGKPAGITIKLNNLEERSMIGKLYEASQAGVKVNMIVRSICCLVPGIKGMSENISVKRIVDRYLEHGRVFIFHNEGKDEVFLGSADWMNRNIHRRIEVCFPVYDGKIKKQIIDMVNLQLQDTVQAVQLDSGLNNVPLPVDKRYIQSQKAIYFDIANP